METKPVETYLIIQSGKKYQSMCSDLTKKFAADWVTRTAFAVWGAFKDVAHSKAFFCKIFLVERCNIIVKIKNKIELSNWELLIKKIVFIFKSKFINYLWVP